MPTLPSGRRVEFSLDRFHALLAMMDSGQARELAATLCEPDDLLHVMDAVHFGRDDSEPFFAGYFASDWMPHAADWNTADRQALQDWLVSDDARMHRGEAITYIKALLFKRCTTALRYPYVTVADAAHRQMHAGSTLRQ